MIYRPKRWYPPKARRTREARDYDLRFPNGRSVSDILRALYPQKKISGEAEKIMVAQEWAKTSLKFGWITIHAFERIPKIWTGCWSQPFGLFANSPLYGLIRKEQVRPWKVWT